MPVVVLCCCGSAEQQQKQQNAQSIERAEVVLWLQSINLDEYRHSIIDYGYDSMTALDHADEDEIVTMTEGASVSMKKPHRVVFIRCTTKRRQRRTRSWTRTLREKGFGVFRWRI